ncbi:hypothetical protein [Rhizobium sp. RAF56]|uniref:hypothetical protein n=1 Tax=Rhizobium sp. RAF56 TaxID=3233062 RepID=UPI003F99F033
MRPIIDMLTENNSACEWLVDADERTAERFSVELNAIIHVIRASLVDETVPLCQPDGSGDRFVVVTSRGTWPFMLASSISTVAPQWGDGTLPCFVNIDDPSFAPQFRMLREAMRLADAALLCGPTLPDGWSPWLSDMPPRFRWLHAFGKVRP